MSRRRTIAQQSAQQNTPTQERPRRQFQLNAVDRANLSRSELIENYIDLLLDLTEKHSYEEMAQILGVTERFLTDTLNNAEDFQERYQKRLDQLRNGTRVSAARAQIEDLAVDAAMVLKEIMNDTSVSPKTRQEAAVAILDRAGINGKDIPKRGAQGNLREFLESVTGGQVNLTQINIQQIIAGTTPQEYRDQLQEITAATAQIPGETGNTPEIIEYNSGTTEDEIPPPVQESEILS